MYSDDTLEIDEILKKSRQRLEKYAKPLQVDLNIDTSVPLSKEKETKIRKSFGKYLHPQKSIEDDLVIQDAEEFKSPDIKGLVKHSPNISPQVEKSPIRLDDSTDINEIIKRFKDKKVNDSTSSYGGNISPSASISISIEELMKKYREPIVKMSPKKLEKSDEEVDQILKQIKVRILETKESVSSTESLNKKAIKMPPRVHQQLTQVEVQKVLRKSLQSKSIEELYTKKSPRSKEPLPRDNLILDKFVDVNIISPKEIDTEDSKKLKDNIDHVEEIINKSPNRIEGQKHKIASPRYLNYNESEDNTQPDTNLHTKVHTDIHTEEQKEEHKEKHKEEQSEEDIKADIEPIKTIDKKNEGMINNLFSNVTAMLFNKPTTQAKYTTIRRSPIKKSADKIPKYAHFETVTTPKQCEEQKFSLKKSNKNVNTVNRVNNKIEIEVKLRYPFENKILYEYLPLLEIHKYDNDPTIKQIKSNIKNILLQLQ